MTDNYELLLGQISIEAALSPDSHRKVHAVAVDESHDWRKLESIRRAAKRANLELTPRTRADLDALAGDDKHGGFVAQVGPRRFVEVEALFDRDEPPFVAMLDGIEDPFNFGQSVRALYAAGCTGLIVRERNWTTAAAVIARSSAGATERIDMAIAQGPEQAAEAAQSLGVMVVATGQGEDAVPYTAVDFANPTLLMIGGERRGLRRSFLADCEQVVTIPYGKDVNFPAALGTVTATSILAFEIARQRA